MDTQYRKNLKAVLTASKDYTDKTKEEIYWHIGDYSISTQPDNTTASTKTVPSGATRCKIKRIYGLTEKFNPSVAYDDASTMTKTMPNVVYDFDCSVVYGNSEVSENTFVIPNIAETTTSGITWKVQNGTFYFNGTANASFSLNLLQYCTLTTNVNIKFFDIQGTSTKSSITQINSTYSAPTTSGTSIENLTTFRFFTDSGQSFTNYSFKIMVVSGTTPATSWSLGFEGIHNFAWNGLKVEGANIAGGTITEGKAYASDGGTYNSSTTKIMSLIEVEPNTQYYRNTGNWVNYYDENKTFIQQTASNPYTTPSNCHYVGLTIPIDQTEIMYNRGSTALPYADYITPTTLPIDLSTILYNGSPLFEGNSLKAVNDVKDSITPYKATKKIAYTVNTTNFSYIDSYEKDGITYTHFRMYFSDNLPKASTSNIFSSYKFDEVGGSYSSNRSGTWIGAASSTSTTYTFQLSMPESIVGNSTSSIQTYFTTNSLIVLFELNTPIEVSIDWSSTLRGITGYSNGTITLQNTYNMDTANTITYKSIIKENCCAKIVQSRGGSVVKTINLTNDDVEYGYSSTNENNVRDYTTNVGTINVGKRAYQSGDEEDTDVITDMEYTYYPLTTPATETLTAIGNVIEVEPGDTIAFLDENDNAVNVPSDITYRIEVERV